MLKPIAREALEKIAMVADVDWIGHGDNVFRFVTPMPIRVFPGRQIASAEVRGST
jgi:hypothetical protein